MTFSEEWLFEEIIADKTEAEVYKVTQHFMYKPVTEFTQQRCSQLIAQAVHKINNEAATMVLRVVSGELTLTQCNDILLGEVDDPNSNT